MTVVVRVEDAQGLLAINPLSGSAAYSYEGGAMVTKIEIDACRGAVPLGLQIEPQGSWKPGSDEISLHIEPKLAYDCRPTEK